METRKVYDVLVVDFAGRLDSQTAGDIGDQLNGLVQGGTRKMVLNLDQLQFVSSAGMRIILRAAKLLQSSRGELRLCAAKGVVKEALATAGFDSLLKLHDAESEAVTAMAGLPDIPLSTG